MKLVLQLFTILLCMACNNTNTDGQAVQTRIIPAAERLDLYLPKLQDRKIGLIVNQTSMVKQTHLVDQLLALNFDIVRIFSPEHGFRGTADAGEKLDDETDPTTGLQLVSLYGTKKKPTKADLDGIDYLIFDIQDVGVRFYTYISTLHYVMEAAAESNIPLLVLDRPNPLSCYIDGPVLEKDFESFVGMHPVPVVYGMTIGEYAQMINGEGWLDQGIKCQLEVIPIQHYDHSSKYSLPIKPSPNLPNYIAIGHYPSLCFFEGTTVSIGRGTTAPFQMIGHPEYDQGSFEFTPTSGPGAKYPKHQDTKCQGDNLQAVKPNFKNLELSHLIRYHQNLSDKAVPFFNDDNFFNLLAGTDQLKKQIIARTSEEEIRASWQPSLLKFQLMRKKYLLYK